MGDAHPMKHPKSLRLRDAEPINSSWLEIYRSLGHPLGKSVRGFKKWLKRQNTQCVIYDDFSRNTPLYGNTTGLGSVNGSMAEWGTIG